jgi:hypothetical protein
MTFSLECEYIVVSCKGVRSVFVTLTAIVLVAPVTVSVPDVPVTSWLATEVLQRRLMRTLVSGSFAFASVEEEETMIY